MSACFGAGIVCILLVLSLSYLYFQTNPEIIILIPEIPPTFHAVAEHGSNLVLMDQSGVIIQSAGNQVMNNKPDTAKPTEQARPETRHIAFLKVHKAASSTLQNIIYRFGLNRNLSFVLPEESHYISKSKQTINTVLPPLPYYDVSNSYRIANTFGKYDILCNHAVFNNETFNKLMHNDTIYIAIVRDPLTLFMSSAYYYRLVWPTTYLAEMNETDFILNLIREPVVFEPTNLTHSKTYNTMAQDFGFLFTTKTAADTITENEFNTFVAETSRSFDFVLIVEMFDESLVLLKRRSNWSLSDILYVKRNSLASSVNNITIPALSTDDISVFHQRNRFDYMLYNKFVNVFNATLSQEHRLAEEVEAFKGILKTVQYFCNSGVKSEILRIPDGEWTGEFTVSTRDCDLMLKDEMPFWQMMKVRHREMFDKGVGKQAKRQM